MARLTTKRPHLTGKLALVTGANRGIGLAIARALARQKCDLVITARDQRTLNQAGRELGKLGVSVISQPCDVRAPLSVDRLFARVRALRRPLNFLINNAGVAHPGKNVEELPYPTWCDIVDTNLNGLFIVSQAALAVMKRGSVIVNNLSVAAEQVFTGASAYVASKHGALGFTNTLREELRPKGIRVVALLPGATDTEIWNTIWPKAPRKKMMSSSAVGAAVVNALLMPDDSCIEKLVIAPPGGAL